MSTFNPGTNEPTGEQGSEPEGWGEDNVQSEPAYGNTDAASGAHDHPHTHPEPADELHCETVAEVETYLDEATDDEDRLRRADEVERAENQRDGGVRVGVTEAIEKARKPRA